MEGETSKNGFIVFWRENKEIFALVAQFLPRIEKKTEYVQHGNKNVKNSLLGGRRVHPLLTA